MRVYFEYRYLTLQGALDADKYWAYKCRYLWKWTDRCSPQLLIPGPKQHLHTAFFLRDVLARLREIFNGMYIRHRPQYCQANTCFLCDEFIIGIFMNPCID